MYESIALCYFQLSIHLHSEEKQGTYHHFEFRRENQMKILSNYIGFFLHPLAQDPDEMYLLQTGYKPH